MTTERELLELAAKAAEYDYECVSHTAYPENDQHQVRDWFGTLVDWNPLENDGDALRLMAKLKISVSWDRFDDDDYAVATPPHAHQGYDCIVDQLPSDAIRQAIVKAAAAMAQGAKT